MPMYMTEKIASNKTVNAVPVKKDLICSISPSLEDNSPTGLLSK